MASMQFQDIAVQAQMGAKWSVIIAQQVPQLLSAFGPSGMIIGGIVAIGGAFWTMGENAEKAFRDAQNAAADFDAELEKTLATGNFDQVGASIENIEKQIRSAKDKLQDMLVPSGGMGFLDFYKDGWAGIKESLGLAVPLEEQINALNERRAALIEKEAEAAQRMLNLSRNQTEIAEMKARGDTKAAEQMERQLKLGQELVKIEGLHISRSQKQQLISDANRRFLAESPQGSGGSIFSRTMDLFSSKFQMAAGPVMQAIKQQLTEQAGQLTKNAGDLSRAAFSPLRGDMDVSFGRGSAINPLTSGAGAQIQQMMKQSALLKQQADKIDTSNKLLGDIAGAVKAFNPKLSYN